MTTRKLREMLRELVRDLEADAKSAYNRAERQDSDDCHPQYLAGLHGGLRVSLDKIRKKFKMRV